MSTQDDRTEHLNRLERLKAKLQAMSPRAFEAMVCRLAEQLFDVRFSQARSGFQEGADMGTVGRQGRRLRLEAKRYSGNFDARDLIGGFHQATAQDPTLEAWIATATRDIPEQLANALNLEGCKEGVPVLSIDFPETDAPPLAALCTAASATVAEFAGEEAGALVAALKPRLEAELERLERELQQWQIGFEHLRALSAGQILDVWRSKRKALSVFGQDVAGGDGRPFVRRDAVEQALTQWWDDRKIGDGPATALGQGGYGKTWATLSWVAGRLEQLPIILTLPARAIVDGSRFDERRVMTLLGERLAALTRVQDVRHWSRRLERLLGRPGTQGPALLLLIDGLNENPQVDWIAFFQLLQDTPFSGSVRAIVTCRPQYFETRLGRLRRLAQPGRSIVIDRFTTAPGGELDMMLGAHGLTQADLHEDLVELARVPRLFPLVIRLRDRLADAGRVTVHRLLWEYGRDVFGERAGQSFSEEEWRQWLGEIARRERAGQRPRTIAELSDTAARPDLAPSEVGARLSDIIDGNFALPGTSGQLSPGIVAHALGAALLDHLERIAKRPDIDLQAELDEWLDPISDLEERAELLRAASSIMAEREELPASEIAGLLVSAWLQSQNLPESHQAEAKRLGPDLVDGFLGAIEASSAPSHAFARSLAIDALRSIPADNSDAYNRIVAAGTRWMAHVSRDVSSRGEGNDQAEEHRQRRFIERVGRDQSGPITIFGVPFLFEARAEEELQQAIPTLLDGRPLSGAAPIFLRAAFAAAIRHRYGVWEDLKWLCLLNRVDPEETAATLRLLSADVACRKAEDGINQRLAGRAAALLLWLTGMECDEMAAIEVDSGIDRPWTYEADYLPDPGRSLFRLERRHAAAVLADRSLNLRIRMQKGRDCILDPTFALPDEFIADVKAAAAAFDMSKVAVSRNRTSEDIGFQDLELAVARCAPDVLGDMHRRKLIGYANRPVETFDASAYAASESAMLVDCAMGAGCRSLRERSAGAPSYNASSPSSLLLAEVVPLPALDQIRLILDSEPKFILVDFENVLRPISGEDVDRLLQSNRELAQRLQNLVCLLSAAPVRQLSEEGWQMMEGLALDTSFEARGCAFIILERLDSVRLGRRLLAADWDWLREEHDLCRHYGSQALIAAGGQLAFEELAPRVHPALLARAVAERGNVRAETSLAAEILDAIVTRPSFDTPDPGSAITVNVDRRADHPLLFSVTPGPMPGEEDDPFSSLARDPDAYEEHTRRAVAVARDRIHDAQATGASLYLSNMEASDLLGVVAGSSEYVRRWLEGMEEVTADFRRRVALAEGFYLALAETLLILDHPAAPGLWRTLRRVLRTHYAGVAGVSELVVMLFRVPATSTVVELRHELFDLNETNTDEGLLDIAVAAIAYNQREWLEQIIEADECASSAWARRRGVMLRGFTTGADLPVAGSDPEGQNLTSHEERAATAARRLARDAMARHWWRLFVSSTSADEAFSALTLFRHSADRRALAWLRQEQWPYAESDDLSYRKSVQINLNYSDVQKQLQGREKDGSTQFLDRRTADNIAPWYAR